MRMVVLVLLLASVAAAQEPQTLPPSTAATAHDPATEEFDRAVFFGKRFFDMKDYGSAYEQFARADAVKPDHPAVLYNMALLLAKADRYAEAQVKVDRYNQLYPGGTERPLVAQLQRELEFQREVQKARQADQEYIELFNRGKFLYSKSDIDTALKAFQEAEQRRPTDPAAVFNQGIILEKQGNFAKAIERFRRYAELESDPRQKTAIQQRIFNLERELVDMRTKIVCSFCGHRLEAGSMWCHRCWHGPYDTNSPILNTRACVENVTATRSTYFVDNRLHKNDALGCLFEGGTVREALRYSPVRQRLIQDARKAEGWSYNGEVIQGWSDKQGNQVQYIQGAEYLERIVSTSTGETLAFEAHAAGDGVWLLDREDLMIDGQKYISRYTFDEKRRIKQQQVTYQNTASCNHVINMTADYVYQNDALATVNLKGGYLGYEAEGLPTTDWQAAATYTYDQAGRVAKEDFIITSFKKTYDRRPHGALRDEIGRLHISMRPKREIENALRVGDLCATSGTTLLANPIDLRPFYAMSPNLAMLLPLGVTRATVSFTYPEAFRIR